MAQDAKEVRQAEREAKQDEKARLRQEKTDAYIAKEDEQRALYAKNEDLEAQLAASPAPTAANAAEIKRVIDANNVEIARLEKDLEKIYNSTLGFVVGRSKKQRLEDMVAAASGAEAAKAAPKEQIAELKTDTLALAAQHLMAAGLLPGDLKGDEPKRSQAARLVGREGASPAELSAFADELQPAYDIEMNIKKAAEDMEKGVVVGRTMDAIKEVAGNPAKMGGAALGLLGAWLLYSAVGHGPSDGAMKWIKGILGVAGLGVGIGVVSGALSYKNIGLGDAVEKLTGVRADEAFSTESMDKVRHLFDGMPSTDTDAVDDFIRIMDAPVENVADMFRDALEHGATEVEAARLLNNGLSSKERKFVDEGSLYTSCSWFFLKCYEQGLAKGDLATTTDEKTKLLLGLDWSKKNFKGHQMGTAVAAFEMVRLGSGTGTMETTAETGIANPALAKLERDVPSFGEVLEKTARADVYLINGYPVRYNHTDAGDHIFTDVLKPTEAFTEVKAVLTGDALEVTLRGIAETAATRAKDLFETKYKTEIPDIKARLKYRPSGLGMWELDPKEPRSKPKGLPNHRGDEKLTLVFYVDPTKQETRVDMDSNLDGAPDGHEPPYAKVEEVKRQFEKDLLEKLVINDTSHVMLGVPFKVLDYTDSAAGTTPGTTVVTVEYGNNAKGTMTYTNDALTSYTLQPDAALETVWNATAEKRIADFLNTPLVQTELLKATGAFTPGTLDGWMTSIGKFFGNGIQWLKDDSIMASFRNDWEKQVITKMKELVYHPTKGLAVDYVKNLFITTSSAAPYPTKAILKNEFDTAERAFFALKLGEIQGNVSTTTVVPEKEPDYNLTRAQAMEKVNDVGPEGGTGMIRAALAPLKSEVPPQMPSLFQEAYQGLKNTFTDDTVRTEWFDKRVSAAVTKLATVVAALPTPVTRDAVDDEIEKAVAAAQREALNYHGLNNQDAVKKLLLAPAEHAQPEWKAASELVASYITNNMKWEKYAFIPNPENMAEIMDLWYQRVGTTELKGATTGMGAVLNHPRQYAEYFIWELQTRMGGRQDYSPEYFYGEVQSVSDTNFNGMITSLKSAVQPYNVWARSPELRPPTPDMLPSIDLHRANLKERFNTWFDKYADCGALFKLDHYWPQVFEGNVKDRFAQIISNPNATVATLDKDVKDFSQWVWLERWMVMEPLMLNRVEAERKGFDIRVKIFNKFPWFFYPEANRTANYPRYEMMIKQQMRDIMSSHHTFPNMPGVPFL